MHGSTFWLLYFSAMASEVLAVPIYNRSNFQLVDPLDFRMDS